MKRRISKILGIGLSAGLVFGLIGTLFTAPVSADLMKWGIVNTPSWEDLVIVPASDILDYDIGGDGDTIYAVLDVNETCNGVGDNEDFALVKSTDGGVTWTDITANVTSAANLPIGLFSSLTHVAVAPDDEDWVAAAGIYNGLPQVVASQDGGDNFSYTGNMTDSTVSMLVTWDLAVSIEVDGIHNIAVAGWDSTGFGSVFRLKAGTWLSAAWEDTSDTTDYLGWDNGLGIANMSMTVVAVAFSPNFDIDDTIVCIVVDLTAVYYIQSGIWESIGGSWNSAAGFPTATEITADGDTLISFYHQRCAGLTLPMDFDGSDPGARVVYLYVDAWNTTTNQFGGYVIRYDNGTISEPFGPPGEPVLSSIDFHGDADTGKMMIGEYIQYDNDLDTFLEADCCEGVRVWHTVELDPCCPDWELACKNPSGFYMALVTYTPDGDKEYATTSGTIDSFFVSWLTRFDTGTPLDESAFSVSRDEAVSFNQLSLIDTDIDFLSDVAVCPDCSTIYLSTINEAIRNENTHSGDYPCIGDECGTDTGLGYCNCDSVWRSYDNGDTWERVFHGNWADEGYPGTDALLLRLPCDAIDDCCDQDPATPSGTIYLGIVDVNTDPGDGDSIFYSRDCGQCWNETQLPKVDIQDFCVESENIVYIIDSAGYFTKSTQYGRRWSDAADTGIGSGHSITCCCEQGFVVVGGNGDDPVAYSNDGGDNWELTADLPGEGTAHIACDPTCQGTIYASLSQPVGVCGGIYRWVIDESSDWADLDAYKYGYYGIVVSREGTLYAATNYINVLSDEAPCDRFVAPDTGDESYSGVARNLSPCETDCCGTEDWDYLICGLDTECFSPCSPTEWFNSEPSALRICGCLSIDTNSILYAIDHEPYDAIDGAGNNDFCGSLWSYEDCAAKKGPTLTSPADGSVLSCEPCAGCDAANFTMKWERMCEACSYDIVIMDSTGNTIVEWNDLDITGDPPTLFVDGTMDSTEYFLECGDTYTWKVREANTSCECVHSPWSETWSFTIAVGAADAINLLAPEKGAMGTPIENIGFSWTGVRNATTYSFVLSPNANLTGALVSQDMSSTAFNYTGPLDYGKVYYWQVIAWEDGTRLTTSSIGVFNTMAKPAAPTPPVVVEEQPAPVINIPAAETITPTWIYAIIGVGCALAVVMIVLIVRTRRP